MKARCPGKLILAGEHAVVHGAPALAVAINREIEAEAFPLSDPVLELHLDGLPPARIPLRHLHDHLDQVNTRRQAFLAGKRPVGHIAPTPADLLFAAAAPLPLRQGVRVHLRGNIPRGAGLGSSAAAILALLRVLAPTLENDPLFKLAHRAEQFQHGHSSGIDVAATLRGGLVRAEAGAFTPLPQFPLPSFRAWFTGPPASTTGECVSAVAKQFPPDDPIWQEFSQGVHQTEQALRNDDPHAWRQALHTHHTLLCRLGVVPTEIATALQQVHSQGGAGKICGAGSVRGATAGVVITTDHATVPLSWKPLHLHPTRHGVRII